MGKCKVMEYFMRIRADLDMKVNGLTISLMAKVNKSMQMVQYMKEDS